MQRLERLMIRSERPRMKYEREYKIGKRAAQVHSSKEACPYGMAEIGRRMAWLAGWEDAYKEMAGDR